MSSGGMRVVFMAVPAPPGNPFHILTPLQTLSSTDVVGCRTFKAKILRRCGFSNHGAPTTRCSGIFRAVRLWRLVRLPHKRNDDMNQLFAAASYVHLRQHARPAPVDRQPSPPPPPTPPLQPSPPPHAGGLDLIPFGKHPNIQKSI